MDKDLQKILQELSGDLKLLANRTAGSSPNPEPQVPIQDNRIPVLEEKIRWHQTVGWGIALLFVSAFGWLLGVHIPSEIDHAHDKTAIEIAAKIDPLSERIAKLTSEIEFLRPNPSHNVPEAIKENGSESSSASPAERILMLQTVKAIAEEAIERQTRADDPQAVRATAKIILASQSNDDGVVSRTAWDASMQLANYISFLNTFVAPKPPAIGASVVDPGSMRITAIQGRGVTLLAWGVAENDDIAGAVKISQYQGWLGFLKSEAQAGRRVVGQSSLLVEGQGADRPTKTLDGLRINNVIFQHMHIKYSGGALELKDVYFVDCTFEVEQSRNAVQFAEQVAADPSVSLTVT
jgi:hypothetical protein